MKKILFILFFATSISSYSQKEVYYVKTNGDTIFCKSVEISWTTGPGFQKYRLISKTNQGIKEKFEIKDIKKIQGYFAPKSYNTGFSGKGNLTQFEIVNIKEITSKNPIPLRLEIEDNNKRLYSNTCIGTGGSFTKYIYSTGNDLVILDKKNYKEILIKLFANCTVAINKLNGKKKYFDYIDELIDDYNKCINKKIITNK
jgi:hypothetical protein